LTRVDRAILDELRDRAARADPTLAWTPFRPGVEIHRLWGGPPGESAALLRYAPGAIVPVHRHEGREHVYVLRGAQRDENGLHEAGSYVLNPPGSVHRVESPDGCLVLVVWERPNTFLEQQ
jgi:anti-sigma factor ChrR (cupin superfamily)